jgi:hypothetical protein
MLREAFMGYKIRYEKPKWRKYWSLFCFLFLIFLFSWYFIGDALAELVFPSELDRLIGAIEAGDGLYEAVAAFCQEILDGP